MDKSCKARKGSGFVFLIELGHYKCKNIKDAFELKHELSMMNLGTYHSHSNFDEKGFAQPLFELRPEFSYVPYLEDFWVDCDDDFEVRKRWWSRLSLK